MGEAVAPVTAYSDVEYEFFLDAQMFAICNGAEVPWPNSLADGTGGQKGRRAEGLDPTVFPGREVPFKRVLMENGVNKHSIAAKWFARAHRRGNATGLPAYRVTMKMSPEAVLGEIWAEKAIPHPNQEGLALLMTVTTKNYPAMYDQHVNPIEPPQGQWLLDEGYRLSGLRRDPEV